MDDHKDAENETPPRTKLDRKTLLVLVGFVAALILLVAMNMK